MNILCCTVYRNWEKNERKYNKQNNVRYKRGGIKWNSEKENKSQTEENVRMNTKTNCIKILFCLHFDCQDTCSVSYRPRTYTPLLFFFNAIWKSVFHQYWRSCIKKKHYSIFWCQQGFRFYHSHIYSTVKNVYRLLT